MYSIKEDLKHKIFLTVRAALPVVILTILLAFVVFYEKGSLYFKIFILLLGVAASIYFIFYIFFSSNLREKIIDDITLTFNRKYFLKLLKNYPTSFVALITIDNIQQINQRYGIDNGDKVLREFAKIVDSFFSKKLKKSPPISRLKGGDFFIVLESDEKSAKELLEEFIKKYDNYFIDNIEIKLFFSMTKNRFDSKSLIDLLYEELYYCKGNCKEKKVEKRNDLEKEILNSVKSENILIFFQPTLNISTKKFDLVEVIVKMQSQDGKLIHPSQFVPVINRLGLENEFDLILIKKFLNILDSASLPKNIFYSFSLSPYSVRNRVFSDKFFSLFKSRDKSSFIIKLFESGVYKDVKYYKNILDIYKGEGFKIAFDNFGSCNASVEYIKLIDANFIYFDKLFTKNIEDFRYRLLLSYWIKFFKDIGTKSIIKFIDDEKKIDKFKSLNPDYLQGFAISNILDANELKNFLKEKL